MISIVPDVPCIRKDGVVAKMLLAYSSKTDKFRRSSLGLGLGLGLVLVMGLV